MPRTKAKLLPPSQPLPIPRHEAFARAISKGAKLLDAYKIAGFQGRTHASAWKLRHEPHVDARVRALANDRVRADTRAFVRRQKVSGDILDAAVKRLADLAFTDPRELLAWKDEAIVNADGEVVGARPKLTLRDSASISPQAATLLRGAFMKGSDIRIDLHDQRGALVDLIKTLKGSDAVTNNVTVTNNTLNVGAVTAQDAATRIAFLLASATARLPAMKTIEAEPVRNSRDLDEEPKDR